MTTELESLERQLSAAILDALDRQERTVLARLRGTKARRGTRHWSPPGERKIDPKYVLQLAKWKQEVVNAVTPVLRRIADAGRGSVAKALDLQVTPTPDEDPLVLTPLGRIIEFLAGRWLRVQDVIAQQDAAGASIEELEEAVRQAYADKQSWADQVAGTHTVGTYNGAALAEANRSGRALRKMWLSSRDTQVRESHVLADGQFRLLGESFSVGQARLMYPGDPTGPPDEVYNCRCQMLFETMGRTPRLLTGGKWLTAQYRKLADMPPLCD